MSEEGQGAASHGKQATAEGAALPHPQDCATLHDASTEVSQTNITQTGGGPAAPAAAPEPEPEPEPAKWRCEACTYENYPLSRKCTMCRTPKPALNEDIFKLQDGASAAALPALEPCGAEAVAERLKPLRISSPAGHSSACALNKWSCATCTYENWPRAARCAMCGAPAPAPASDPDPPLGASSAAVAAEGEGRRVRRLPAPAPAPAPHDWLWLQACLGVVEGSARRVEAFLAAGGDPARALSAPEAALLQRPSAFDAGHTLVHLAIRFQRQEILSTLLSRISGGGPGLKRSPSYIAPDLAAAIRRQLAACVRYKKGSFPCRYINEFSTFSLPCEIEELPAAIQEQLFSELLDQEAQRTLEDESALINWSGELCDTLGSRLYALWNRSAGDCLPDAVWQAASGVADRSNTLRSALADTLHHAHRSVYARWAAWERAQAARLHYTPEEAQLRAEWARLAHAAAAAGTPLHQLHVFVLAHVMRRPLIVYGVDVVNSFRGEALGYARFRGIYLPLLWEPGFCSKSPLCLGYTRGHFSALVPAQRLAARYIGERAAFVPLTDGAGKLLPVPFLSGEEAADAEGVVRRWTRAAVTRGGVLAARLALPERPLLQAQMLEEWLNHYRRLAQQSRGPFPPPGPHGGEPRGPYGGEPPADYGSEPDTDDE